MSFFSKFGIDWKLLIIQLINFAILLYVLRRFLYKPILDILDKRREAVKESLNAVEKMKEEMTAFHVQKEQEAHVAREASQQAIKESAVRATEIEARIVKEAKTASEKILTDTRKLIETEKVKMVTEAKKEIAGVVIAATEKLLSKEMSGRKEAEDFVKNSLS